MADEAVEAGAKALQTFLEATYTGSDVTRLPVPPASKLPADTVYFRMEEDGAVVGTVGATADFLRGHSTTALVELLHTDDLPGAIDRAGGGSCVVLAPGQKPSIVPLA